MKSLEEVLKENNVHIEDLHSREQFILKGEIIFESIFQLESLINEVISQRLGEPVGFISKESIWRLGQGGNDSKGTVPIHKKESYVSKYPLYALNIES